MAMFLASQAWGILTLAQEVLYSGRPEEEVLDELTAVAEVIRNRVRTGYASDGSIEGTVLRPHQFSGWSTGDPNRIRTAKMAAKGHPVFELAGRAWHRAWVEESDLAKGAVLYHALSMKTPPYWASKVTHVADVGQHRFFTDDKAR